MKVERDNGPRHRAVPRRLPGGPAGADCSPRVRPLDREHYDRIRGPAPERPLRDDDHGRSRPTTAGTGRAPGRCPRRCAAPRRRGRRPSSRPAACGCSASSSRCAEVGLPHDLVDADEVAGSGPTYWVRDDAHPEVLGEDLRRRLVVLQALVPACAPTCSRAARARRAPHPAPPSDNRDLAVGVPSTAPQKMRSPSTLMQLTPHNTMPTDGVVSGDGRHEARSTCRCASTAAARWRRNFEHRPPVPGRERRQTEGYGFSVNRSPMDPFAAQRSISTVAVVHPTAGSASGG